MSSADSFLFAEILPHDVTEEVKEFPVPSKAYDDHQKILSEEIVDDNVSNEEEDLRPNDEVIDNIFETSHKSYYSYENFEKILKK
jgi:hypothetical protein